MSFIEFKNELLLLAENESIELIVLENFISEYFIKKPLPHLETRNRFVVRCSINEPGEVFTNISRCSYPPDLLKGKIKVQRSNYPGQQVFYCTMPTDTDFASASSTVIVETAWEYIEDINNKRFYATVSRWDTSRPLNLWILPFSEISCKKNRDINRIRNNIEKLIIDQKTDYQNDIELLEFFSDAFCQREDKEKFYRITSAFYNALLNYEKIYGLERDGLFYPSSNTEAGGINIVLKKDLIDNQILNCTHVIMHSVQKVPNNPKNIKFMPASNDVIPDSDGGLRFQYIV